MDTSKFKGLTPEEVDEFVKVGYASRASSKGNRQATEYIRLYGEVTARKAAGIKEAQAKAIGAKDVIGGGYGVAKDVIGLTPDLLKLLAGTSLLGGIVIGTGSHIADRNTARRHKREKALLKETGMYEDAAIRAEERLREMGLM